MSDAQTKPARFKKRYVAIVALAGLVATGGIVGATITAQSTIAGNKITVSTPVPPAVVTVEGSPVIANFDLGNVNSGDFGKQTFTLSNDTETPANVKVVKINDLLVPQDPDPAFNGLATFRITGQNGTAYFTQAIGDKGDMAGTVIASKPIVVGAKSKVTVEAFFRLGEKTGLQNYTKTFPVEFEYSNKTD